MIHLRRLTLAILGTVALALAATGCASTLSDSPPAASRPQDPRPFLLGGIQTHEKDHQRWVAALHQAGMNAVQVTAYAHQGPWNTSRLWYSEEEAAVLDEIRAARRNGLQVVLILRVALHHSDPENRFLWHGLTYPQTEQATKEWFRHYTDFVVKWGRIAEQEGVDVLGIASEMNALAATLPVTSLPELPVYYLDDASQERLRNLVKRSEDLFSEDVRMSMGAGDFLSLDDFLIERNRAERAWAKTFTFAGPDTPDRIAAINRRRGLLDQQWRRLIREVRRAYSGRLTLAANFDNYHEVGFWDALDFIGINAYFPLRKTLEDPVSVAALTDSWRQIFEQIETFQKANDLSQEVVFTELGYTRWQGVTVAPWSSEGFIPMWDPEGEVERDWAFFWSAQPLDPNERALAVQALHRVWREDRPPLAGILYWKLSSLERLQRFEPFMLHIGAASEDPLYDALTRFAEGIRPYGPRAPGKNVYSRAVDAAIRDDVTALEELGPKVQKIRGKGREPLLHLATRLGRRMLVERLIKEGASLVEPDAGGLLPIHWACYQDDPELVDLLLPSGPASLTDGRGETPLMKCARLDNTPVLRRLVEQREDLVPARSMDGQTALHLAVDQGSLATVEALVAAGADISAAEKNFGGTPLHFAARRGDVAIVQALAASAGAEDAYGNRAVHWAAYHGQSQAFRLLFEAAEEGRTNPQGQGLLHFAAHGGNLEILSTILEHTSEIDPVDSEGKTPLFFAVQGVHPRVVGLLLQNGASARHRDLQGVLALHLAGGCSDPQVLHQFLGRDLDLDIEIDLADNQGNTTLHYAAGWGFLENLRMLIEAGADISLRNKEGQTALDLARELERRRVVQLLGSPAP